MQDPRISRPPFFWFYMEIYFVARNEASVRQFNRRSISARIVLRSNQAATVWFRPSYRPITVSLFYQPYHRTAVWIIKLIRPTARSWHVCRHPARPPDHLPVSYYPAYAALSAFPSAVRPPVRSPGSCSVVALRRTLRRSPAQSASPVDRPFADTRSLLRFLPRCSCDRLFVISIVSRRLQRRPRTHLLSYENGGCQFAGPYL